LETNKKNKLEELEETTIATNVASTPPSGAKGPRKRRKAEELIPPPYTRADYDRMAAILGDVAKALGLVKPPEPRAIRDVLTASNAHPIETVAGVIRRFVLNERVKGEPSAFALLAWLLKRAFPQEYTALVESKPLPLVRTPAVAAARPAGSKAREHVSGSYGAMEPTAFENWSSRSGQVTSGIMVKNPLHH
jgi:hypothetical protein